MMRHDGLLRNILDVGVMGKKWRENLDNER